MISRIGKLQNLTCIRVFVIHPNIVPSLLLRERRISLFNYYIINLVGAQLAFKSLKVICTWCAMI